ncbi:hypothetical protein COT70_01180 [candidate division WWE3 bacterium CG09_land_8_20_14_0_10_47_33]|nr:MAG: hypothetical protein COT70_01180 [candidate division WWE3 bacterium CG09_land_8_20_14_0_10_47_33]
MAQKGHSLYYTQGVPLQGTREQVYGTTLLKVAGGSALDPNDPVFRETSFGFWEVWDRVAIKVTFPKLATRGDVKVIEFQTDTWKAEHGHVLRPMWRPATDAEKLCLRTRRRAYLPTGFSMFGGRLHVRILEHFDSLDPLIRQLQYHIPASYMGLDLLVRGEHVVTCGDTDSIRIMDGLLDDAYSLLCQGLKTQLARIGQAKEIIGQVATLLMGAKTAPKVAAWQILATALAQGGTTEISRSLLEARARLTEEEIYHGVIVAATIDNARRAVKMVYKVQQGVDGLFERLGKLFLYVNPMRFTTPQGSNLERAAQAAERIWREACQIGISNPYCAVVQSSDGKGVKRACDNLRAGNTKTASHNLALTIGTWIKIAKGEGPQRGFITDIAERARREYPQQLKEEV